MVATALSLIVVPALYAACFRVRPEPAPAPAAMPTPERGPAAA